MAINASNPDGSSHSWHVGFALRIRFQGKRIECDPLLFPSIRFGRHLIKLNSEDEK